MTFPRIDHTTRDTAFITTGRAIDEKTGNLRFVVGHYVRIGHAEHALTRLRADAAAPQRYDRSACPLDRPCGCREAEHLKKED